MNWVGLVSGVGNCFGSRDGSLAVFATCGLRRRISGAWFAQECAAELTWGDAKFALEDSAESGCGFVSDLFGNVGEREGWVVQKPGGKLQSPIFEI